MAPKSRKASTRPTQVVRTAAAERSRRTRHGGNVDELERRLSDPERLLRQARRATRARKAPASRSSRSGRSEVPLAHGNQQRPSSSDGVADEQQLHSRQLFGGRDGQVCGGEQSQQSPGDERHHHSRQASGAQSGQISQDSRSQQIPEEPAREQQSSFSPQRSPTGQQPQDQQQQSTDSQTGPRQPPIGPQAQQPSDQPEHQQSPLGQASAPNGFRQEVRGSTGNEQQNAGAGKDPKQPEGEKNDEHTAAGKRGPESDGEDNERLKRQKDDGQSEKEGEQANAGSGSTNNSCHELERLMRECRSKAEADLERYQNPVTYEQNLDRGDVIRTITTVSERIMITSGHRFSVMDGDSLRLVNTPLAQPWHRLTRRRHEALIPCTTTAPGNQGHTSLFILQPQSDGNSMLHRDSARSNHSHRGQRQYLATQIRNQVHGAQWHGDQPLGNQRAAIEDDTTPQGRSWTCGIHTIFNAWAYALGLALAVATVRRYDEFIQTGSEIIQLAVRGHMTSRTIWAFFDCFGFILPGQAVPVDRQFEDTLRLLNEAALVDYAARQRIQEDLDDLRQHPGIPADFPDNVDTALMMLDEPHPPNTTGVDLVNMYRQVQAMELSRKHAQQNATEPQDAASGSYDRTPPAHTPHSPVDSQGSASIGEETTALIGLGIQNVDNPLVGPIVTQSPVFPPADEIAEREFQDALEREARRFQAQAHVDAAHAAVSAIDGQQAPRTSPDYENPSPSAPSSTCAQPPRTSPDYENPPPSASSSTPAQAPRTSPDYEVPPPNTNEEDSDLFGDDDESDFSEEYEPEDDEDFGDDGTDNGSGRQEGEGSGERHEAVEPESVGSYGSVGFEDEELDYGDGDDFDEIYHN